MTVTLGDGIEGLFSVEPKSARLILSDLPSGETQADFDKKPNLRMLWHACWQALRPDGVVVFMASSFLFACELTKSTPHFRYDLIWRKSAASGFLNAAHRPLRNHEFILIFFRETGGVYVPQMTDVGVPINAATRTTAQGENYGKLSRPASSRAGATDRFPVSVLEFASVGTSSSKRVHPQQKPEDLLRYLVRTYSLEGELVIDPYAGSGSSGRAAIAEGRRFLGWDSDERFGSRPSS
jgi:site-specific DNA-methyltransferase (adenine-specific)